LSETAAKVNRVAGLVFGYLQQLETRPPKMRTLALDDDEQERRSRLLLLDSKR
jgi:hypothetical protein